MQAENLHPRRGLLWVALGLDLAAVSPVGWVPALVGFPQARVVLHLLGAACAGLAFPRPVGEAASGFDSACQDERSVDAAGGPDAARSALRAGSDQSSRPAIGGLMCALAACFPVFGIGCALGIAIASGRRAENEAALLTEYRELVDVVALQEEMPADARPAFWPATWRALELTNFDAIVEAHSDTGLIASAFESAQKLDLDVACAFYRKALGSRTAVTRYYASTALSRAEEKCDKALQEAEAARAANPDDVEYLLDLGDARLAYAIIGDPVDPVTLFHIQEAAKVFQAAFEKLPEGHPRRNACRLSLARALLSSGDPAGARPHFAALMDAGSCEVTVIVGAAEACHRIHDYHGLLATLITGLERNPDAPVLRRLHAEWVQPAEVA